MRDARIDPPDLHVVDPHGQIHACRVAVGVSHPYLDRAGCIRPGHRAAGFVTLEELYEASGPAGGFAVYLDAAAATKAGKRAVVPAAWLPAEVLRRRAVAPAAGEWSAPQPPAVA